MRSGSLGQLVDRRNFANSVHFRFDERMEISGAIYQIIYFFQRSNRDRDGICQIADTEPPWVGYWLYGQIHRQGGNSLITRGMLLS